MRTIFIYHALLIIVSLALDGLMNFLMSMSRTRSSGRNHRFGMEVWHPAAQI